MESIWTSTVKMPHFPPLWGDARTDVLVIGGGMAGLLCARALQEAGVSCAVAEARTITGGITQNTTAKITAQHGLIFQKLLRRFGAERTKLYWQANRDALEAFRALSRQIDCDFAEQDHFVYSQTDLQILERELAALEAIGCPAELVQQLPLPFPTAGAVKFSKQAQFHPLKFLSAISEKLTIYENTAVRELTMGAAITDRGKIHADAFVVATHFPFLNKHGSYFLKLYQQRSYAIALENAQPLEGMYLDAQENGLSFRSYRDCLIVGGGGHRTGKAGGGWPELEGFAKGHFPQSKIIHRCATQDCMTLDGMPYIGQYSARTPNLYVATGFNKWGMTSSMVAAQLLTDLLTGKENPFASVFSPSRSILHSQLGINAWEAARNLLSPAPKRCPHMGCALKWNSQEHSWDCPCHGSRFTENGKLIDNPAAGDLKKQE
ncbi:MAG: FAD-dependent oxidoreductase [Faecousia sp.]